jgi:hypothetical protein
MQSWSYPLTMGPCHNGMARPQVADGGMPPDMTGDCDYIAQTVADSRPGRSSSLGVGIGAINFLL